MWVFACWRSVQTFAVMCWGIYTHPLIKVKQAIISDLNFHGKDYTHAGQAEVNQGSYSSVRIEEKNWQA